MIGLGLSIPSVAVRRARGIAGVPDDQALFARMTTQPNEQRKAAISTCIADLKAAGVWSRLDALYVMAAHDAQAARQNWKSDNFNLVATASPLFTVDRGYKGDTSAAYLQTGFVVGSAGALMQRNSAHMGIWPLTDAANGNYVDLGARTSPTFCEMLSRIANPAGNAAIRLTGAASTAAVFPLNPVTSASHLVASRLDAARVQHFQNGGMVVDAEYPSNGTPNPGIYILASNNAGTPIGLTNREISIAHFGAGLTASQTAAAHAAFRKYLQAVGAVAADPVAPAKMASPTLTAGDGQIGVTRAAAPSDGGSPITSYDARYGPDGVAWTTIANIGEATAITGLTNGTAYQVQTRANNAIGNGAWSDSAAATPVAAVSAFADDFSGDGQLGARPGWTFLFGSQATGATSGGRLGMVNTAESGWTSQETGSTSHFVEAVLVNVGTNGPLLCVDVQDADNWYGVRNAAASYSIVKKVAGTVTVVQTISGTTPAVGDLIRFEQRNRDLNLMVNGVSVWSSQLAAGELVDVTRGGVVGRTAARNPWIDDWRSGPL